MVHVVKSPLKTKPFCQEGINHFSVFPQNGLNFPAILMDAVLNSILMDAVLK